ncbi:hypothetical protein Q1695_011503 [Nippostrongylus brasiliensis]|nr:hypothetical protein Q1695_011503 [Nippostrongylus brasiliensis]
MIGSGDGCPYCYHYQPVYQTYAGAGLPAFMESPRTIFYRSPRYQIVSEENPVVIGEQYDALPTPQHAVVISNDQSVINDAEYDPYITMRFRNYGRQPSRATFSSGRKAISEMAFLIYRGA